MHPKEQSWTRHRVDPVDLRHSPDYTLIYGVNVNEDSSKCIIEYDDNRRKNRTWHLPLKNNHFIMLMLEAAEADKARLQQAMKMQTSNPTRIKQLKARN